MTRATSDAPEQAGRRFSNVYARSTGFKLFVILSLALLPLGLIALFATLQSNRTIDEENQARMRIALTESSRQLTAAFAGDIGLLRATMEGLEAIPDDPTRCRRLQSIFATQRERMPRYAIFDASSTPWCASPGFAPPRPSTLSGGSTTRYSIADEGLDVVAPSASAMSVAILEYAPGALAATGMPGGLLPKYSLSLSRDGQILQLVQLEPRRSIAGYVTLNTPLADTGLALEMVAQREPFTVAELASILLPLLMWAAAALIGWLVVDRLLIRPLRRLQRTVSAYVPGDIIDPLPAGGQQAHELRELSMTFQDITRRISTHEAELAEGLARQTRLTREVHHRVKNNLQVVASLINLHARGQTSADVLRAYASIQRRVDALAVVHRNHFAELEENRGIGMRSLVGELAQNIRGSVAEGELAPPISLQICPAYVAQDVAVPVAFLLTELVELAMMIDPAAPAALSLQPSGDGRARLSITSPALVGSEPLQARMADRFGRVLDGLSRQLRSPLDHDREAGQFCLEIPVLAID